MVHRNAVGGLRSDGISDTEDSLTDNSYPGDYHHGDCKEMHPGVVHVLTYKNKGKVLRGKDMVSLPLVQPLPQLGELGEPMRCDEEENGSSFHVLLIEFHFEFLGQNPLYRL